MDLQVQEFRLAEIGFAENIFAHKWGEQFSAQRGIEAPGILPVMSVEWRPTLILNTGNSIAPEMAVTAALPVSFMYIDETSSYQSRDGKDTTTYSTLTRLGGPKVSVAARYPLQNFPLLGYRSALQFGAGIGVNAYGYAIEKSIVEDGLATRQFQWYSAFSSVEPMIEGGLQVGQVTGKLGATWDSFLGTSAMAGFSVDVGGLDAQHRHP